MLDNPRDESMVDQSPDELRLTHAPFADGMRGVWDALIANDETPIDADVLSAYADGRLSDRQRRELREQIARSPRAIELLDSLYEQTTETPVEPARRSTPASIDRRAARSRFARALPVAVAAAMLLCAVGLGIWNVRKSGELAGARVDLGAARRQAAALEERMTGYRRQLTADTKEELIALSGSQRPYMTAAMSPRLVELALNQDATARGPGDAAADPPAAAIDAILSDVKTAYGPLDAGENGGDVLDWVDILIAAGDWRQAGELMNSADVPETAESLNLRAGILLAEAADLANETGDDVEQRITDRRQRARTLLGEAVELDADFDPAWFNLFVVHRELNDFEAAGMALEAYERLTGRVAGSG